MAQALFPPPEALQVDRDLGHTHMLVRARWPALAAALKLQYGLVMFVNETYRSEVRQQYLYGAGRTPEWLKARGIDPRFARPKDKKVTNAWSATNSAHGWTEKGLPAAAAIDVVPVGPDGKPWTADDEWEPFVNAMATIGPSYGMVHFHAPGKAVWDKPHLQLVEWSDTVHRVVL